MSIYSQFLKNTVSLYEDYYKVIDSQTQRGRSVSEVEKADEIRFRDNDIDEATGVIQLFLSGLNLAITARTHGDLEKYDVVTGDHNCHIPAAMALLLYKNEELNGECETLLALAKKRNQVNIKSIQPTPPRQLIESSPFNVHLSEGIKFLACAAILRYGTTCLENRQGGMTLKVEPDKLKNLAKICPLGVVKALVTPMRERINGQSIQLLHMIAQHHLSPMALSTLHPPFLKKATTNRGEVFAYPCAFYNMKATLLELMQNPDLLFILVEYDPKRIIHHPPIVFQKGKRLTAEETLHIEGKRPVFVLQAFFNEEIPRESIAVAIETQGLTNFILSNMAVNPQFTDLKEEEFAKNEDLASLPGECQAEIAAFREVGRCLGVHTSKPTLCRITHTYADTYQNVKEVKK